MSARAFASECGLRLVLAACWLAGCGRNDAKTAAIATTEGSAAASPSAEVAERFRYQEGASSFTFATSGAVRLLVAGEAGARTCDSVLGEGGNMWTRADVLAAFDDPVVQKALKAHETYRSSYPSPSQLSAGTSTIRWVTEWKELPPPEPPAVHHVHEILHVVLTNRTSLCP